MDGSKPPVGNTRVIASYASVGSIPDKWRLLSGLDCIAPDLSITQHPEATLEIRSQSKTGPLVPSLAEIPAKLRQQIDAVKQQWLDQLNRDPASFARLEVESHDHFRHRADQMTASLLAEATIAEDQAEPGKKRAPAAPINRDAPRKRGG